MCSCSLHSFLASLLLLVHLTGILQRTARGHDRAQEHEPLAAVAEAGWSKTSGFATLIPRVVRMQSGEHVEEPFASANLS